MRKYIKCLITVLFILSMYCITASAADMSCSKIGFYHSDGSAVKSTPAEGERIQIKAGIKNEGSNNHNAVIVAAMYDNDGKLVSVSCKAHDIQPGSYADYAAEFVYDSGYSVVTASVLDDFTSPISNPAHMLSENTGLEYITVGGIGIKDYSDTKDTYYVCVGAENAKLDIKTADASAKVEIGEYSFPGTAEIKIVPQVGGERKITVTGYKNESDLYALKALQYKIGTQTYAIDNFSPDRTNYTVTLPDNVYYVTVLPEYYDISDCSVYVKNSYSSSDTFGSSNISYGTMDGTSPTAFAAQRYAHDGIIPIKYEKATAYITVKNGTDSCEYTVNFISRQPALTSFQYVGAATDTKQPVFVGGGGMFNDNGTVSFMDRRWIMSNISKNLIGASYFEFPVENKESGTWWHANTSGEYFNFTADMGGTAYLLSADSITNNAYVNDGWTVLSQSAPSTPNKEKNWNTANKAWNDYDESKYFMASIQWTSDTFRSSKDGLDGSTVNISNAPYALSNVAKKKFEMGEEVKIYHTGKTSAYGAATTLCIVWDEGTYTPTPVSGISLDRNNIELNIGAAARLTATVMPENASNKKVIWKSSKDSVAEVDKDGNVTALSKGEAVIRAMTEDGGYIAECVVTVDRVPQSFDEHLIALFDADNNTYNSMMDITADYWKDLSGKNNSMAIVLSEKVLWTEKGLKITSSVDTEPVKLPDAVTKALEAGDCSIVFTLSDIAYESGKDIPVIETADASTFRIYYDSARDNARLRMTGATMSVKQPSVSKEKLCNTTNVITIHTVGEETVVNWYVDGALLSSKALSKNDISLNDLFIGGSTAAEGGSVTYKTLAFYNKVLTEEEAGEQQNLTDRVN